MRKRAEHRILAPGKASPWILGIVLVLVMLLPSSAALAQLEVELYSRAGCPHCEQARRFLSSSDLNKRFELVIVEYDVGVDADARERLRSLCRQENIDTPGVPTFVIGRRVLVGFDPAWTPKRLAALIESESSGPAASAACEDEGPDQPDSIEVPLIGALSVDRLGLPLFTVAIGVVDGFNPCATWVLLFLLAMLVNLKDRKRMALIAGTFVAVSGLLYFAFMAAWLSFFVVIGVSGPARFVLGTLALLMGGLHIKDFFAMGSGPSLSIPAQAKPGFYARVRAILRAENIRSALAGIVVVAFLVNLVELLCTAGLPALYTAILSNQHLPTVEYYSYLALYIAAYMLDDAVLVAIGVITLSKRKLQERGGRWLKLISGLAIAVLGLILLMRPGWIGF